MTITDLLQHSGGARVGCAALLVLLISCAHGAGSGGEEKTVSVIVQAPDMQHAVRAVALAGGTVTHELGIIRSVGATVTPAQLELLRKVKDVQIRENRTVSLSDDTETEAPSEADATVDAAAAPIPAPQE